MVEDKVNTKTVIFLKKNDINSKCKDKNFFHNCIKNVKHLEVT